MDIYFLGAISGLQKHRPHFERIVSHLEKLGHNVQSDHILERDPARPETFKIKSDQAYFKITMNRIKSSDLMVADISHPTVNIGYEMSFALQNKVPVLSLYFNNDDFKMTPLLIGNDSDLLLVKEYQENNLEDVLVSGLSEIEQRISSKFIFTASPRILNYLSWISLTKKVSRSTYLKNVIEERIVKDKDYQEYIASEQD